MNIPPEPPALTTTYDPEKVSPRKRLPPISDTSPVLRAGLTREQSWALTNALAGFDILLTGTGGTGKSHLLSLYLKARLRHTPHAKIYMLAPHLSSITKSGIPTGNAKSFLEYAGKRPLNAIFIIDEFSNLTPQVIKCPKNIAQIVMTGDPAQETDIIQTVNAIAFIRARNGLHLYLTQSWRLANGERADLSNALLLNGRYETISARSSRNSQGTMIFPSRPESISRNLCARLAHNIIHNPKSRILAAASRKEDLTILVATRDYLAAKYSIENVTITHTALIQGAETDIMIATPPDTDEMAFFLHAIGRARHRLELITRPQHQITEKLFSLKAVRKSPLEHPEMPPETGLNIMPDPKDPENSVLIPFGPDPRTTIRRMAIAASLRWNAKLTLPPDRSGNVSS